MTTKVAVGVLLALLLYMLGGLVLIVRAEPVLHSGWNLVGLIEEPTPQEFFAVHPNCPYIYGWDAVDQHWHWRFDGLPEWVMGPRALNDIGPLYGYFVWCSG